MASRYTPSGEGYSAYVRYIVTALVLVAAVTVDSLTRRGGTARSFRLLGREM